MLTLEYFIFFQGLVPMNFCEKLTGEDLLEFHQQVVLGFSSEEEVWSTMVPTDLPMDLGGTGVGVPQVGPMGGLSTGGGLDSSGLLATPIDDPAPYQNPCKFLKSFTSFFHYMSLT